MKTIIITSLLFLSFSSLAGEEKNAINSYYTTYEVDSSMSATETKVLITCDFSGDYPENPHQLRYGLNGSDSAEFLSTNNELFITPAAGSYLFQFYYNSYFREIETDSIEVKPGVITHISLYFFSSNNNIKLKKPVIYLYPETATSVFVNVKTEGLAFTYPILNDGWNVIAQPDGTLACNGKNYPYLFWEADQSIQNPFETETFEGFVIAGKDALTFLEEKLTQLGFNDKERTDFITFWGPQLAANEFNNVTFEFNEACDAYGTLDITPKPENVNRVYMIWSKTDASALNKTITPQSLPALDRSGFDVLEWGGIEIMNAEL
ncbi:MAG: hypothetical protein A3D31_03455 [Candidatus Fluviicola riflensis]|nr:MAG: hypothetical protein CHH17_11575 [Candidatus Fluviicola riflensis]OGS79037.1 MAG: hypothetical protein A3D31_03455 [Candidatus Fluviicola riflensis]OGS86060.1 MAG: hypothetical protein A3E30_10945 [Fluviicola sp. RIFCSPHIGHO2_12_FULL_43_24]OGS86469.1 MAG: hypothetical protein A2724_02915 [Fluviicola sp. RIFCSPHIGHO2_01_FULL_43_53]